MGEFAHFVSLIEDKYNDLDVYLDQLYYESDCEDYDERHLSNEELQEILDQVYKIELEVANYSPEFDDMTPDDYIKQNQLENTASEQQEQISKLREEKTQISCADIREILSYEANSTLYLYDEFKDDIASVEIGIYATLRDAFFNATVPQKEINLIIELLQDITESYSSYEKEQPMMIENYSKFKNGESKARWGLENVLQFQNLDDVKLHEVLDALDININDVV